MEYDGQNHSMNCSKYGSRKHSKTPVRFEPGSHGKDRTCDSSQDRTENKPK